MLLFLRSFVCTRLLDIKYSYLIQIISKQIISHSISPRPNFLAKFDFVHQHHPSRVIHWFQQFDAFFIEPFVFGLKIRLSFRFRFLIGAKSLSLEHSFEVCKQLVLTGGQIWRIEWMQKQFEVQFMLFCHCCDLFVTLCIFLVKEHFSTSFVAVFFFFLRFLPSNAPIMLYNIPYWCFSLSQNNRGTKYHAHPKMQKPKPCLLMFESLVALGDFHLLLSSQLTADSTPKWSSGSMFHPLLHIYEKPLFVGLKQLQTMLWIVDALFLIDCEKTRHPFWTHLSHWQMFMQNGEYTAFWYLQLPCYLIDLLGTSVRKDN